MSARYSVPIDKGDLTFSGRLHRGKWDSVGYITQAQFNSGDPFGKDPRTQNDGGDKTFGTLRVDFSREITPDIKALAYIYGTQQTYTRFFTRPVNATTWRQRDESYDRSVTGLGFSFNGLSKLGDMPLKWIAGFDSTRESTEYDFYDGTSNRARSMAPVFQQDRDYQFNSQGFFAEGELAFSPLFRPTIGFRADRYTGNCRVLGAETVVASDAPCNVPLKNVNHTSPKIGVRSTIAKGVDLRASYNEGFQLANVRGLYSATNNTDPTVYKQKEVGLSLGPWSGLKFDLALYELNSDKEIRELPAGSGIFVNSGKTRRSGADIAVLWSAARNLDLAFNYGLARTKILANPSAALVGKELNGVPKNTLNVTANYSPLPNMGVYASVNRVGSSFYGGGGLNTTKLQSYTTVDAGITWQSKIQGRNVKSRVSVNNLANKVYAANAFQIGGVDLVAPGAPRSVQLGMQIDF